MAEGIYRITSEDDPERCQSTTAQGQCLNKAMPGVRFCKVHNGAAQTQKLEQENIRNYQLAKWQARIDNKATAPQLKSLRDEVAILRMLLEERLNACNDATDLILQSGPLSELVLKIDKVVCSCHRLESVMGQLLDKQAILQFAQKIIGIIGSRISDQETIDLVASDILKALGDSDDATR